MWLGPDRSYYLEFDRDRRGQRANLDRGPAWLVVMEIFCVDAVIRRKIRLHIREKNCDIDDVLPTGASVIEDVPDVAKDGPALLLDIVGHDLAGTIQLDARDL